MSSGGGHKRKRHWYFITVHSCPLCGRTEVFRERRYDERPERYEDRHKYAEPACLAGCIW